MITLDEQIEWVHRELKQSEEQGWKGSVAACTAILATLRAVKHQGETFEQECADTDKILSGLGLDPGQCRTDGGSLKVAHIINQMRSVKQAEPVAWMLTEIGPLGKGAKVARTSKPIAWDKTQWKLEPLYAAPPPPQLGKTRQRG